MSSFFLQVVGRDVSPILTALPEIHEIQSEAAAHGFTANCSWVVNIGVSEIHRGYGGWRICFDCFEIQGIS